MRVPDRSVVVVDASALTMTWRASVLASVVLLLGCSESPGGASARDAGDAALSRDLEDIADLGTDATPPPPPPDAGGRCSFNRDCAEGLRCECSTATGCRCLVGPRGTGVTGVDACRSGNDCDSALCVEATTGSLCSDACRTDADCPAALPRCLTVPTVGTFCARRAGTTPDAGVDAPPGCMGPCATTTLAGVFGARRAGFDRAFHGAPGSDGVYIEAYAGGAAGCPTMTSPTPLRTLALRGLHGLSVGVAQTQSDGVTAVLFDFSGDLTSAPLVRATAVRVVPRAIVRGEYVSLDVSATFADGTISGGLFAPHCTSLD